MIIGYTITNNIISSIISISEKIGRIKEIRNTHKHIDFDTMCNVKNIQNTLRNFGISYPDSIVVELMKSKSAARISDDDKDFKTAKQEVEKYRKIKDKKSYHPARFVVLSHNSNVSPNRVQIPREVIKSLKDSNKSFLYRIAEFCFHCDKITNDTDLIQLWLITLFLKEYDMILYFPYKDIEKAEASIKKKGKSLIEQLKYEATTHNANYLLLEFYLAVIDSVLEECIKIHYKLTTPISDRVELLQGTIKEPFSRKDYMTYYKISEPTASLDLRKAVEKGILTKIGDKRNTMYEFKNNSQGVL